MVSVADRESLPSEIYERLDLEDNEYTLVVADLLGPEY
jgi:hypothetical protein